MSRVKPVGARSGCPGRGRFGNSPNVLRGVEVAKAHGMVCVGFTGGDGGKLAKLVDYPLIIPSRSTPRIQEVHITIGHALCLVVEMVLCGEL